MEWYKALIIIGIIATAYYLVSLYVNKHQQQILTQQSPTNFNTYEEWEEQLPEGEKEQ
jgi:uncharacterized membrane protein